MLNKAMLSGNCGGTGTLTVEYDPSAWWPTGWYLYITNDKTGEMRSLSSSVTFTDVKVGDRFILSANKSSFGTPDKVMYRWELSEGSTGVESYNLDDYSVDVGIARGGQYGPVTPYIKVTEFPAHAILIFY